MASPQTPHRTARPQHAPAGAEFGLYQIVRDYDEVELSSGLYVFPDTVDFFIWHICIFVNAGPYSSGVFRAVLTVHPHYPAAGARPLFVFVDKPLHPLVDAATGALQLEARFPAWTAEDRLTHVVSLAREVLNPLGEIHLPPPRLLPADARAMRLYHEDEQEFLRQARLSALQAARSAMRSGAAVADSEWRDTAEAAGQGLLLPPSDDGLSEGDSQPRYVSPSAALVVSSGARGPATSPAAVAAAVVDIGRRRGFRFSDLQGGGTGHEVLLRQMEQAQVFSGAEVVRLISQRVPSDALAAAVPGSPGVGIGSPGTLGRGGRQGGGSGVTPRSCSRVAASPAAAAAVPPPPRSMEEIIAAVDAAEAAAEAGRGGRTGRLLKLTDRSSGSTGGGSSTQRQQGHQAGAAAVGSPQQQQQQALTDGQTPSSLARVFSYAAGLVGGALGSSSGGGGGGGRFDEGEEGDGSSTVDSPPPPPPPPPPRTGATRSQIPAGDSPPSAVTSSSAATDDGGKGSSGGGQGRPGSGADARRGGGGGTFVVRTAVLAPETAAASAAAAAAEGAAFSDWFPGRGKQQAADRPSAAKEASPGPAAKDLGGPADSTPPPPGERFRQQQRRLQERAEREAAAAAANAPRGSRSASAPRFAMTHRGERIQQHQKQQPPPPIDTAARVQPAPRSAPPDARSPGAAAAQRFLGGSSPPSPTQRRALLGGSATSSDSTETIAPAAALPLQQPQPQQAAESAPQGSPRVRCESTASQTRTDLSSIGVPACALRSAQQQQQPASSSTAAAAGAAAPAPPSNRADVTAAALAWPLTGPQQQQQVPRGSQKVPPLRWQRAEGEGIEQQLGGAAPAAAAMLAPFEPPAFLPATTGPSPRSPRSGRVSSRAASRATSSTWTAPPPPPPPLEHESLLPGAIDTAPLQAALHELHAPPAYRPSPPRHPPTSQQLQQQQHQAAARCSDPMRPHYLSAPAYSSAGSSSGGDADAVANAVAHLSAATAGAGREAAQPQPLAGRAGFDRTAQPRRTATAAAAGVGSPVPSPAGGGSASSSSCAGVGIRPPADVIMSPGRRAALAIAEAAAAASRDARDLVSQLKLGSLPGQTPARPFAGGLGATTSPTPRRLTPRSPRGGGGGSAGRAAAAAALLMDASALSGGSGGGGGSPGLRRGLSGYSLPLPSLQDAADTSVAAARPHSPRSSAHYYRQSSPGAAPAPAPASAAVTATPPSYARSPPPPPPPPPTSSHATAAAAAVLVDAYDVAAQLRRRGASSSRGGQSSSLASRHESTSPRSSGLGGGGSAGDPSGGGSGSRSTGRPRDAWGVGGIGGEIAEALVLDGCSSSAGGGVGGLFTPQAHSLRPDPLDDDPLPVPVRARQQPQPQRHRAPTSVAAAGPAAAAAAAAAQRRSRSPRGGLAAHGSSGSVSSVSSSSSRGGVGGLRAQASPAPRRLPGTAAGGGSAGGGRVGSCRVSGSIAALPEQPPSPPPGGAFQFDDWGGDDQTTFSSVSHSGNIPPTLAAAISRSKARMRNGAAAAAAAAASTLAAPAAASAAPATVAAPAAAAAARARPSPRPQATQALRFGWW